MVNHLVRQQGVPALAYLSSGASMWPCLLSLLHDEPKSQPIQFTALLTASVPVHGIGEQTLVLAIHGDNLAPGRNSLGAPNVAVSHARMSTISREGNPIPQTLSLTLKGPCSIRYHQSLGSVARVDTPCHELVALAHATEMHILLDSRWLSRTLAQLNSALRYPSQLAAVPVHPRSVHALTYLQAPSSILHFVDDADAARPSVEIDDAPPPYAHASSKRQRRTESRTPTPDKRLPKRLLQDDPWALPAVERATPQSTPPATAKSDTAEVDTLQDLVSIAVKKALSDALRDAASKDRLQELVASTVRSELPSMLDDMLPRMLRRAQVVGFRRPLHPPPPLPPVVIVASPLNEEMREHIKSLITTASDKALDSISDEATDLHTRHRNNLSEELADHRVDVQMVKDDHLAEFTHECDDICERKKESFKQEMKAIKERIEDEVDEYGDAVVEGIERMKTNAEPKIGLRHEFACRRCMPTKLREAAHGQGRRAASMPL